LGDAILKLVITNGIDVKNVTHLGRGPTVAQQVALWWESPTCRVLDCACTSRLQNDHRNDWTYVHETVFENLDPLCQHHHNLKTRYGWALPAPDRGQWSHPTTPATPNTAHHRSPHDRDAVGREPSRMVRSGCTNRVPARPR
jgi:hypothetical protein